MSQSDRIALAAYYRVCGLRYDEIARVLRVDVSTVSRDVRHAEARGWLRRRFELTREGELLARVHTALRDPGLESELVDLLGRKDRSGPGLAPDGVVVVKTGDDMASDADTEKRTLQMLGVEGCSLLIDRLVALQIAQPNRDWVLGIAWGRSTGAVASTLTSADTVPVLPRLRTVPLQGGVGGTSDTDERRRLYPDILCHEVATAFASELLPISLSLPAFVDPTLADELGPEGLATIERFVRADTSFAAAARAYGTLDVGLVGVGSLDMDGWAQRSGFMPDAATVARLRKEGMVGDIVCRLFGDVGHGEDVCEAPTTRLHNQRAIGITLAQLRQRVMAGASVIAVAGGLRATKAVALRAAVRNGWVSEVVTDEHTARRMLVAPHR